MARKRVLSAFTAAHLEAQKAGTQADPTRAMLRIQTQAQARANRLAAAKAEDYVASSFTAHQGTILSLVTSVPGGDHTTDLRNKRVLTLIADDLVTRRREVTEASLLAPQNATQAFHNKRYPLSDATRAQYRYWMDAFRDQILGVPPTQRYPRRKAAVPHAAWERDDFYDIANEVALAHRKRDMTLILDLAFHGGVPSCAIAHAREAWLTVHEDRVLLQDPKRDYPYVITGEAATRIVEALQGDPAAYIVWPSKAARSRVVGDVKAAVSKSEPFMKRFQVPSAVNLWRTEVLASVHFAEIVAALGMKTVNHFYMDCLEFLPVADEGRALAIAAGRVQTEASR